MTSTAVSDRPKHRACDECRARKLACSKEADGCRRCKREGISCVYSTQKQMGRPRKRRAGEQASDKNNNASRPASASQPGATTTTPATAGVQHSAPGDVGLDLLHDQSTSPGVSFFDFLGISDMDLLPMTSPTSTGVPTQPPPAPTPPAQAGISQQPLPNLKRPNLPIFPAPSPWGLPMGDIDFSSSASTSDTPSGGVGSSDTYTPPEDVDAAASSTAPYVVTTTTTTTAQSAGSTGTDTSPGQTDPAMLSLPPHSHICCVSEGNGPISLCGGGPNTPSTTASCGGVGHEGNGGNSSSSNPTAAGDCRGGACGLLNQNSNRTDNTGNSGTSTQTMPCVVTAPSRVCSCLARMYLALDSLQDLPTEISAAITVARSAAHAAHDTMICPSCSPPHFNDIHFVPPLQSFQNLLILSALLPSIAHAYRRIVEMVDIEAERAAAAGEKLSVGVKQYGGIWGRLARWDSLCASANNIEGSMVDPPLWRLAMRALLKVDVYGVHVEKNSMCQISPSTAARHGLGDGTHVVQMGAAARDTSDPVARAQASYDILKRKNDEKSGKNNNGNNSNNNNDGESSLDSPNMTSVHIGLKDIVDMMEARAKFRHDCLDAAADAGMLNESMMAGYVRLPPGEKHSCQKVIEIARAEIDKLVIA